MSSTLENAEPVSDEVFRIETHGVDYIPTSERWTSARTVGSMWAGVSLNIEYFIYGASLIPIFGLSFGQALAVTIIGNMSYFLLGVSSLQGPTTGTTVFGVNRASYGPNGSRLIAFFNWLTQIGFEIEGLILIETAAAALAFKAGFVTGTPGKVIFVLVAVVIQAILPVLGHATIVKTMRALMIPFFIVFAVMLGFAIAHGSPHSYVHGADWKSFTEGLAYVITLSGLGWMECGNDYTRYCPPETKPSAIVGWVFLGTALPEILIMTLGLSVSTFVKGLSEGFMSLATTSALPAWFVVVFIVIAILQLFGINSLDMYSSGVTLQALGVKLKRYQATILDCVLAGAVTIYAVLASSFAVYLNDFVDAVIIWIAPWSAIFLIDWLLRGRKYVPSQLQRTDRDGLYYRQGGIFWPAIIAQIVGMYGSIIALSATFPLPEWLNWITYHTTNYPKDYGADFSVYLGIAVAGLVYLVLGGASVRRQARAQETLLAAEVTSAEA